MTNMHDIAEWKGEERDLPALTELMHVCVHGGASVNFILPYSLEDARGFWVDKVLPAMRAGERRVLVVRVAGEIAGSVQLAIDTPPNQPHRAEVTKLLVHPRFRRQGLARELMTAVEELARAEGRTLLTLNTVVGSEADPLYRSMGWVFVGEIPGYSLSTDEPVLNATSIFYKNV